MTRKEDMLTIIYQAILAIVIVLLLLELFSQKKITGQMTAVMALIPFTLRLFMIG